MNLFNDDPHHEYSIYIQHSATVQPDGSQRYNPDTTYEPRCSCGWTGEIVSCWAPGPMNRCFDQWQGHYETIKAIEDSLA